MPRRECPTRMLSLPIKVFLLWPCCVVTAPGEGMCCWPCYRIFSLIYLLTRSQLLFSRTNYAPIYTRNNHWYVEIGSGRLRE
ncbi:hypothetical protein HOY80DRAFT_982489 [Tuber brumale]|nr:hypothetical protein HOY80DRAFT_982489 [Tuber brumale]